MCRHRTRKLTGIFKRDWLLRAAICIILCLAWALSATPARADVLKLDHATLITQSQSRGVALPHRLAADEFDPAGSVQTFRLTFTLPAPPVGLQAIYIPKLSLSGQLKRDGKLIWACGASALPELRCLHRPHLIQLPEGFLRAGSNTFDLEIFADGRQSNGLAPVFIGPYEALFADHFQSAHFLKVDLVRMLAIFAAAAGILSVAAGLAAPNGRIFFVFGAAALAEAAAFFVFLEDPPVSKDFASWVTFTIRFIGVPLKLLLFYEAFGRFRFSDPMVRYFLILTVVGTVLIGLTGSDRMTVLALYLLLLLGVLVSAVRLALWTYADPSRQNLVWASAGALVFLCGVHDYRKVSGIGSFDGVFLLYFFFPVLIAIIGVSLVTQMGAGLRVAQTFAQSLRQQVSERTAELQSALSSIRMMEDSALRLTANIPFGTFTLRTRGDTEERFIFFSERLRRMLDLTASASPPSLRQILRRLHRDDRTAFCSGLRLAISDGRQFETEFRIKPRGQDWRWFHVVILPQRNEQNSNLWDGAVIDVTDARQAQESMRLANNRLIEATARQSQLLERERLLQDMHDGFGAQLSSARLAIEHGTLTPEQIARVLLECSEDLRLMVDALGNEDGNLANAIADFRYRTDSRVRSTKTTVAWDVSIREDLRLAPATILQILRVLQEATTNALRHSGAQRIAVSIRTDGKRLRASVADMGVGISAEQREGRGLSNMRKRCREIGARLTVAGRDGGTTVSLEMSLPDGT